MISIEKLNEFGVNTREGLDRCLNKEDFYFRLITKAIEDESFLKLKEEIENKNYEEAFKIAHSLKGVFGNLSITPIYEIVFELTEYLRNKSDINYKSYIDKLLEKRNELIKIINE
jgi:HPt (histidine-containing phosphotransfer) domain-containing protein